MRLSALCTALLLTSTAASAADLLAGQHTVAGEVSVTDDGKDLIVKARMDADYAFTEVHLHAGCSLKDIPTTKKGNPRPGLFDYTDSGICSWGDTWRIPLDDLDCDGEVVVAFHAVVNDVVGEVRGDIAGIGDLSSPAVATFSSSRDAYFATTVNKVEYDGWCVDLDHFVEYKTYSDVDLVSSYSKEASAWVDKAGNLDQVNYLLNEDLSRYSAATIQEAIWVLVDEKNKSIGGNKEHRAALVKQAQAYGKGFEPGIGENYSVLLVKDANHDGKQDIQVTIIEAPVPADPVCGDDTETGWADGDRFVKKGSWATYMTHSLSRESK